MLVHIGAINRDGSQQIVGTSLVIIFFAIINFLLKYIFIHVLSFSVSLKNWQHLNAYTIRNILDVGVVATSSTVFDEVVSHVLVILGL